MCAADVCLGRVTCLQLVEFGGKAVRVVLQLAVGLLVPGLVPLVASEQGPPAVVRRGLVLSEAVQPPWDASCPRCC